MHAGRPNPTTAPLRLLAVTLALAACEHAAPGVVAPPADVGPFTTSLPRPLTFHAGDNRTPSVAGGVLVYARQGAAYANVGYAPTGREECLAFLPAEGGSIQRLLCPHQLLPVSDTFVHTWFEPALSPDGSRIAFMWQRGRNVGPEGYLDAHLMVTPVDRPADTTQTRVAVSYVEPDAAYPRRADLATHITWTDATHLRFLAAFERIFALRIPVAQHATDTLIEPLALMELDLATGALRVVPGGDSALAYATAPSGGVWLVRAADSAALVLLDPATGTRAAVGRFSSAVVDLAAVDGAPVAVVSPVPDPGRPSGFPGVAVRGGQAIERLDPASGALTSMAGFAGPVHRLAPAGGRRFVAEIEPSLAPLGVPPKLWLFELP